MQADPSGGGVAGMMALPFVVYALFAASQIGSLVLNCYFAAKKQRSVVGWFFWGLFFPIFSTIIIAFLPPTTRRA